jgi:hypothetical protein
MTDPITMIFDELGHRRPLVQRTLTADTVDINAAPLTGEHVYHELIEMAGADSTRPVSDDNPLPSSDILAAGTRTYNFAVATYTAVTATSSATALGTLNAAREVLLIPDTDCVVAFGTSAVMVAADTAGALPLSAGDKFHLRLSAGITHFAAIQMSAAGHIRAIPVA